MPTLIVPGVSVETRFDVLPPLPAQSGILGAVGIVDQTPAGSGLQSVTRAADVRDIFGRGTAISMPEVMSALANGVSEVFISPVANAIVAGVDLLNADSSPAVHLRCRFGGARGNDFTAEVRPVLASTGAVSRVAINLFQKAILVESYTDLVINPGGPNDMYDAINQQSQYVVALDPGLVGKMPATTATTAVPATIAMDGGGGNILQISPASGAIATGLSAAVTLSADKTSIRVQVFQNGPQEDFPGLVMDPASPNYLPDVLASQSHLIQAKIIYTLPAGKQLPAATLSPVALSGGASPQLSDYQAAIDLFSDEPTIDSVLASIDIDSTLTAGNENTWVRNIHQSLLAHAIKMGNAAAPRIAYGSISPSEQASVNTLSDIRDHAGQVRDRRFVLVAPTGAEGAIAGLVGQLDIQDSPTFKPVQLLGIQPATYREGQLNTLLGSTTNLLVVQNRVGHGVIVLKGINTFGDQISVLRVADDCVRETKAIAENFIGQLNTDDARTALKQQIVATLTTLTRQGALVPSTDGSSPPFVVDVYSTQQDFDQGIVRIDIAVRPVRAIDYVYATIRVQN